MLPKTISSYGGVKVDAKAVSNAQSQLAASEHNRASEDLAQSTITVPRVAVSFGTVTSGDPLAINTTVRTVWGSGTPQKPVITRSGTGLYLVTWPTSFTDALGVVENLAFVFAPTVTATSGNNADDIFARPFSFTSNAFSIQVESPRGTLADLGDISAVSIGIMAWTI